MESMSPTPSDASASTMDRIQKRKAYRQKQEEKRKKVKHAKIEVAPSSEKAKLPQVSPLIENGHSF